ncbi:MAG: T9SS type A sorting domain-containing protein [Bacteroidetes bacterium]|nr:T9SS type A sorting domain-containing protein [Bacteroidota bacterium]
MKKLFLLFALIIGLLTSASTAMAQTVNMSSYITLTVGNGQAIKLNFRADAAATPVRIVSGSNTQNITVSTDWYNSSNPSTFTVTAAASTMTVYGDLTGFNCSDNGANLTALDVSHNTQLEWLNCGNNRLTTLDVSHNTQLTGLYCSLNQLYSLDVSKNTQLTDLSCYDNNLTSLDVSKNTQLTGLYCHGNNLSTQVLDDIYCALPDRTGKYNGVIQPVFNSSSLDHATVKATNKSNATAKNWKVQYWQGYIDIPATTGKHKCSTTTDIAEASAEPTLTLYPNPVADVLYLSATARTIRIYDMYGTEVAHATDTDRVEVSHLPAGIYTVRADGTVAKMVKR